MNYAIETILVMLSLQLIIGIYLIFQMRNRQQTITFDENSKSVKISSRPKPKENKIIRNSEALEAKKAEALDKKEGWD